MLRRRARQTSAGAFLLWDIVCRQTCVRPFVESPARARGHAKYVPASPCAEPCRSDPLVTARQTQRRKPVSLSPQTLGGSRVRAADVFLAVRATLMDRSALQRPLRYGGRSLGRSRCQRLISKPVGAEVRPPRSAPVRARRPVRWGRRPMLGSDAPRANRGPTWPHRSVGIRR